MAPAWHSGTSLAKARSDIQTTQEQEEREKRMLARTPMGRGGDGWMNFKGCCFSSRPMLPLIRRVRYLRPTADGLLIKCS